MPSFLLERSVEPGCPGSKPFSSSPSCWERRQAAGGLLAGASGSAGSARRQRPRRWKLGRCRPCSAAAGAGQDGLQPDLLPGPIVLRRLPLPTPVPAAGHGDEPLVPVLGTPPCRAGWDPPGPCPGPRGAPGWEGRVPLSSACPLRAARGPGGSHSPPGLGQDPHGCWGHRHTHTQGPPHSQSIPGVRGCGVGVQDPCPALTCPPTPPSQ